MDRKGLRAKESKVYFANKVFTAGFLMVVLGNAPLVGIVVLAKIGVWPDPDPNPIGPGLLSFVTFVPGLLMMIAGVRRVKARRSIP